VAAVTAGKTSTGGWRRNYTSYAQPLVFAIVGLLVPTLVTSFSGLEDRWMPLTTMVLCAIFVLFTLGLNVVVGYAGLLDLGYVAFFLFGAYTAAWLMSDFFFQISPGIHLFDATVTDKTPGINVSFWIVLPIAALVAAIAGIIIGAPTLRLKSDYLALVTLGFGEILPQVFRNAESIKGFNLSNGTKGISPVNALDMGWLSWTGLVASKVNVFDYTTRYYIIYALCVMFVLVSLRLRDGKLGRAWLAIREDELAASLMGVPLMRTKLWAYAVGAAAGGIGGAFYAVSLGGVNVDTFNFQFSVNVLCMVILGGMANVYGCILGAVILTWVNYTGMTEIGKAINSALGTSINIPHYQFMIFGSVLVLMMLFRRNGILPAARTKHSRELDEVIEARATGDEATEPAEAPA
jgi:branched-chain amino acid transport system permease protein